MADLRAPTVTLTGGVALPRLGLGTYPMDDAEAQVKVARAIELGYRMIDTAHGYGNETGVGRGLRDSGIPREELFVTTKLEAASHGKAEQAWERSAGKLGVDYIDLYLIHWPDPAQDRFVQAFESLLQLREQGRVRAVGVSNFKPAHLERLHDALGVFPDVNQIQLCPSITRQDSRAFHERNGIVTASWGPLGQDSGLLTDPVLVEIAERYGRTPGQVVLRWHQELGLVPIPKTSNPRRMSENLDVFGFSLTADEVARIGGLDHGDVVALDSDVVAH